MLERIRRGFNKREEQPLTIEGLQQPKNFNDYTDLAIRRSNDAKEFSPQAQGRVTVRVPDDAVVSFISDVHAFHPTADHERLREEVEVIRKNKHSAVILGGDLVEGVFWGGASMEQVGSLDEQKGYLRELFKSLKGKVVGAVSGEHDSKWAARTGADPYADFQDLTGAPYKRGLLEIDIVAGKEKYSGLVAHRMRGSSLYNNLHPTMRANREVQGFDFYLAGHTHRKGVAIQAQRHKDGARNVAHGIGGSYKEEDEYTQRSGWISQKTKQLYGFTLRLAPDTKRMEIDDDIVEANRKWG